MAEVESEDRGQVEWAQVDYILRDRRPALTLGGMGKLAGGKAESEVTQGMSWKQAAVALEEVCQCC